jgi:adenosylhomocysteinase
MTNTAVMPDETTTKPAAMPESSVTDSNAPIQFKVADLSLAEWGRNEIRLAEQEMPGLIAAREEYGPLQPLAGLKVAGSLHMTVQTAVLIETLVDLGADVRWVSCNIFSTQDHAAAAVVVGRDGTPENPKGSAVFAWKGETLEEYWWCTDQMLEWPDGTGPDLLVDDGGDATLLLHKGAEYGTIDNVPAFDADKEPEEWGVILDLLRRTLTEDPGRFERLVKDVRGVSEETTTGVHRLYEMEQDGTLLIDGLNRATDVMISGKSALVLGYGDVGKGCAQALKAQGARVSITEIDPICALQACMEGFTVVRMEDVLSSADLFITATGNKDIITAEHMAEMKDKAIVANIGHFDNEIDMAGLERVDGIVKTEIKPQYHEWTFEDGHSVLVLAEGRLMNLGCATGHPSFVMSASFTNQVIAQIELAQNTDGYGKKVYVLPKHLDEKVARLHLDKLGARLTELSDDQSSYINVPKDGPYKPEHYRY